VWHEGRMQTTLAILVAAALLATLGVLAAGVIGVARQADPKRSNALMRWRVLLQFAALALFALLLVAHKG